MPLGGRMKVVCALWFTSSLSRVYSLPTYARDRPPADLLNTIEYKVWCLGRNKSCTQTHRGAHSYLHQQYGCPPQDSTWHYRSTTGRCRGHLAQGSIPPTMPAPGRDIKEVNTPNTPGTFLYSMFTVSWYSHCEGSRRRGGWQQPSGRGWWRLRWSTWLQCCLLVSSAGCCLLFRPVKNCLVWLRVSVRGICMKSSSACYACCHTGCMGVKVRQRRGTCQEEHICSVFMQHTTLISWHEADVKKRPEISIATEEQILIFKPNNKIENMKIFKWKW